MDNVINIEIEEVVIDNPIIVAEQSEDNIVEIDILSDQDVSISVEQEEEQIIDYLTETLIKKGYSPYINEETGTWFEYDDVLQIFVDTHISATSGVEIIPIEEVISLWNKKGEDFE